MIKIEQLLPLLKKGWVAMYSYGTWTWFSKKPVIVISEWMPANGDTNFDTLSRAVLSIEPVKDWTKSLMRCSDE